MRRLRSDVDLVRRRVREVPEDEGGEEGLDTIARGVTGVLAGGGGQEERSAVWFGVELCVSKGHEEEKETTRLTFGDVKRERGLAGVVERFC